jgi:hypothetical protein
VRTGDRAGARKTESKGSRNLSDVVDEEEHKPPERAFEQTNWLVAGPKGAAAQLA